jgi:hypothetical protein
MKSQVISQTYDSSTLIPNSQLRKAINLIENGKIVQEELTLTKEREKYLENRLKIKDSILFHFATKEQYYKKIDSNYKIEIGNFKQVISNDKLIYNLQSAKMVGLKRKKWLFLAIGSISTYLITK